MLLVLINYYIRPFDSDALSKAEVIAKGLAASPGAATGKIYFTAEDVMASHERGEKIYS